MDEAPPRGAPPRLHSTAGRALLGALGIWPWAHFEDGKLPTWWRHDDDLRRRLMRWHHAAFADLEAECSRAKERATEHCRWPLADPDA